MNAELKRRVEALRRPLELAAADNFRGVRRVQGLGNVLRIACDGLIASLPVSRDDAAAQRPHAAAAPIATDALTQWRATLARWEQLGEDQQAIEVARGMRLIARVSTAPAAPIAEAKRLTAAPRPRTPPAGTDVATTPARSAMTATSARASLMSTRAGAPADRASVARASGEKRAASEQGAPSEKRAASELSTDGAAMPAPKPRAKKRSAATEASPAAAAAGTTDGTTAGTTAGTTDGTAPGTSDAPAKKRAKASTPAAEAAPVDPLALPTSSLPGIGPAFAAKLAEKGLETVEDLLWCLPRRYDDVRDAKQLRDILELDEGTRATFVARVTSARMVFVGRRRWAEVKLTAVEATSADPAKWFETPATTTVRWFNVWAGIDKRMPPGSLVTLSGPVKKRNGRVELANPDILAIEVPDGDAAKKPMPTIIPRYPEVTGVPASRLRQACQTACARVGATADDGVPASVEAAAGLVPLGETLARLHSPAADISGDDLAALNRGDSVWQRRLAFGELFALGVAVAMRKRMRRADTAVPCPRSSEVERVLGEALPFAPTGAQRRAFGDVWGDLAQGTPMNRLLQGDVGSGKTCVAFAAALQVASAGRQTAVMAPTELLAEQHAETWKRWAASAGQGRLRIEILTASTPKPLRASLLALMAAGKVDVVIGTHALIAESVGFGALGLVVIDEQHRFGVAQRAKLRDKGDGQGAPHLLVMTATPIPRTLALTAYGDLDVSVLDELPPGRQPVATQIVSGKRGETAAYALIAKRVAGGERAYVVCPKVEASEAPDDAGARKDATTVAGEVAAALPDARVGLVHGRLDSATRDRVMRAFKDGELDVLVATTVIEVGVDVPQATVMVVHDAERFGLAQLHQLRGRVGRGSGTGAGQCVLITGGGISEDGRARLDAMVATTDGFVIAEADLSLRGPGELLGPRQAGIPRLRFGSLQQHTALLLEARSHAERVLDEDPELVRPVHTGLRSALTRRFAQSVYGAESG